MNLVDFKRLLDLTGLPVTYSHWTPSANSPVPPPPYICYLVDGSPNMMADNKVYHKVSDVNIELYSIKKDLATEAKLEEILDEHELPYESSENFISSEKLFQKIYEVRLL